MCVADGCTVCDVVPIIRRRHMRPKFRLLLSQAHDLSAQDLATNSSDPIAILKVGDTVHKSKGMTKTINPKWEETFDFACTSTG